MSFDYFAGPRMKIDTEIVQLIRLSLSLVRERHAHLGQRRRATDSFG